MRICLEKSSHILSVAWCSGGQIYSASVLSSAAAGTEDTHSIGQEQHTQATCSNQRKSITLLGVR